MARLKKKAGSRGKLVNLPVVGLRAAVQPGRVEIWAEADGLRAKIRARAGRNLPDSTRGIRRDRDSR